MGAEEGEGGRGGQLVCWCGGWAECVRRPALERLGRIGGRLNGCVGRNVGKCRMVDVYKGRLLRRV